MAARLRDHATYEDLLRVPENMVAELIEGELYASPRPAGLHTNAMSVLGAIIGRAYQLKIGGPGGWWILDQPELHFRHNVLVPEVCGWRRQRMPELPKDHIFSVVPDWVCEVTSPANGRIDRLKKMPIYAREGVGHAWLVEPEQQVLELYRRENSSWLLVATYGDHAIVRAEPFEAIEIDMTLVWGPPPS
jgi:Uma2 family endonuclease